MSKPHCSNPSCTWSVEVAITNSPMTIPGVSGVVPRGTKVETTTDTAGCQDNQPSRMRTHKTFRVVENPSDPAGV